MKRTTTIETIITIAKENTFAINDHNNKRMALSGLCVLNNGYIGALIKTDKPYSINELYVENNELHISEWSITGVVITEENNLFSKEGIANFNNTITFDSRKIAYVLNIKDIEDSINTIDDLTLNKYYRNVKENIKNMEEEVWNNKNFKNGLSFCKQFKTGFSRKLENYELNYDKFMNRTNALYTGLGLWAIYSIYKRGLKGHLKFAYSNPGKKFLLGVLLESIVVLSSIKKKGDK